MTTDDEANPPRQANHRAGDERPVGDVTGAGSSGSPASPAVRSRRFNMHQRAAFICIGLAIPFVPLSPPIAASLILCGITSFSIGLLVKQSQ